MWSSGGTIYPIKYFSIAVFSLYVLHQMVKRQDPVKPIYELEMLMSVLYMYKNMSKL